MRTTALGVLGPQLANHRCRDFSASIILGAIYTHRDTHPVGFISLENLEQYNMCM